MSTRETVGLRIIRLAAASHSLPIERKALAKALGVEYETLRKWTQGLTAPNRSRALHVASVLGVPVEVVMHDAPASGLPAPDAPTALNTALEVMAEAMAKLPESRRAELGDLLRQWAAYGGRDLYRSAISELMAHGTASPGIGELIRPLTQDAIRVARLMDRLKSAQRRSRVYAHAQSLAQEEADQESADVQGISAATSDGLPGQTLE